MRSKLCFVLIVLPGVLANTVTEKSNSEVPCIDKNKFYRNPKIPPHSIWSSVECSKYYLCLDNEVYEFKCSQGLLFDVAKQICDFKTNVDNCDVTSDAQPAKPLLRDGNCDEESLACGDGTCLPAVYFCDGSVDCPDGSDEGWCDMRQDTNAAPVCDAQKCRLPSCWCSKDGIQIPGNLTAHAVPQMIAITFDDAVNADNFELYSKIFTDDRKNPNGCPMKGTFYISHQYTNYRDVQYLWNTGHEIAAHSVTHRGPEEWWARNATIEDWFDEMVGVANIIKKYAAVRIGDIKDRNLNVIHNVDTHIVNNGRIFDHERSESGPMIDDVTCPLLSIMHAVGMRAPFLQVGWNRQFLMMSEFGFVYDSSIVVPFSDPPLWPYTLDYKPPHPCIQQLCPTRSFPNIWELPINPLLANNVYFTPLIEKNKTIKNQTLDEYVCNTIDSCLHNLSGEEIYKLLMLNFKRHYLTNRAPLGLHFHASWFQNPIYFYTFNRFVDDLLQLDDVFFVTSHQIVEWMRKPTPLNKIEKFTPWQCASQHFETFEIACNSPNSCKLPNRVLKSFRYLHTCFECPKQYPWLRNEFGIE